MTNRFRTHPSTHTGDNTPESSRRIDLRDAWLSIDELCAVFGFSRASFYRWLRDPRTRLAEIVTHLPGSGRIRVLYRDMEQFMRGRGRRSRRSSKEAA